MRARMICGFLVAAVAVGLASVSLDGLPSSGEALASAAPTGEIAYVETDADAGYDSIWLMNADGSDRRLLAGEPEVVGALAWSKDGSQLAAICGLVAGGDSSSGYFTEHYEQIWIIDADGSDIRRVELDIPTYRETYNLAECDWSPDGSRLAITASYIDDTAVYGEAFTLLVVDVASGAVQEFGGSSEDLYWGTVSWRPDGSSILVSAYSEDNGWFLSFDPDTGSFQDQSLATPELTDEQQEDQYFMRPSSGVYSPDGSRLAYLWVGWSWEVVESAANSLVVGASNGSSPRVVLESPDSLGAPSWSPDGQWLVFSRTGRYGSGGWKPAHIAVASANGTGTEPIDLGEGSLPAWRPAGEAEPLSAAFAPIPYGYAFPNRGYRDVTAACEAWTHLYGRSVLFSLGGFGAEGHVGIPPWLADLFNGGVCYGMATSSLAAYQGYLDPGRFKAGAETLYNLGDFGIAGNSGTFSRLPAGLKTTIEEYFTVQYALIATEVRESHTFYQKGDQDYPQTMREFADVLSQALESGPVYLSMGGTLAGGGSGGHAVVAFRVDIPPGGTGGEIEIYDNNHPGEICYVELSLQGTGSWSYPSLFKSPTRMSWVSIDALQPLVDAPAGTLEYNHSWVETSSDASIRFEAADGAVTGKVDGAYLEDYYAVRLDPVEDGGLGERIVDRYAVQGSDPRAYRVEAGAGGPAYISGRGPDGAYVLAVEGTADVTAAYEGDDVRFSGVAEKTTATVENGVTLGQAVFIRGAEGKPGAGAVRMYGPTGVEIESDSLSVSEVLLATEDQTLIIDEVPAARTLRVDLADYEPEAGVITLALDEDGDGTFEAAQEVGAGVTKHAAGSSSPLLPAWLLWLLVAVGALVVGVSILLVVLHRRHRRKNGRGSTQPPSGPATGPERSGGFHVPPAPTSAEPDSPTITRFCPWCGTPVEPGDAFCGKCGRRVAK